MLAIHLDYVTSSAAIDISFCLPYRWVSSRKIVLSRKCVAILRRIEDGN